MGSGAVSAKSFNKIFKQTPDTVVIAGVGRGRDVEAMRAIWPNAKLIGVEPVHENVKILDRSGRLQLLDAFFDVALWHCDGQVELYLNYEPDERATAYPLYSAALPEARQRTVQTMTLDSLAKATPPWPGKLLIWLDAEGAEYSILQSTVVETAAWINVEVAWTTSRDRPLSRDIEDLLLGRGFSLFCLHSLSRNGRQADAVFVPTPFWESHRKVCAERDVRNKQQRVAVRKRRRELRAKINESSSGNSSQNGISAVAK
jgi:FkbM family methyltransferase